MIHLLQTRQKRSDGSIIPTSDVNSQTKRGELYPFLALLLGSLGYVLAIENRRRESILDRRLFFDGFFFAGSHRGVSGVVLVKRWGRAGRTHAGQAVGGGSPTDGIPRFKWPGKTEFESAISLYMSGVPHT